MRYLLLSGNKGQYCSAVFEKVVNGVRYRDKLYLGKIVDRLGKDRVVVYSSKRGHFVYNLKDEVFETLPDDYVCPSVHKPNKIENFGDGYLLYHYIFKTKFIEVINSLYFENKDTLIVLIIAAMLGITSSIDIANWYNNNFIKHLCPKAVVESQRIAIPTGN